MRLFTCLMFFFYFVHFSIIKFIVIKVFEDFLSKWYRRLLSHFSKRVIGLWSLWLRFLSRTVDESWKRKYQRKRTILTFHLTSHLIGFDFFSTKISEVEVKKTCFHIEFFVFSREKASISINWSFGHLKHIFLTSDWFGTLSASPLETGQHSFSDTRSLAPEVCKETISHWLIRDMNKSFGQSNWS